MLLLYLVPAAGQIQVISLAGGRECHLRVLLCACVQHLQVLVGRRAGLFKEYANGGGKVGGMYGGRSVNFWKNENVESQLRIAFRAQNTVWQHAHVYAHEV